MGRLEVETMTTLSWNIILLIYLSAIHCASPARLSKSYGVEDEQQKVWERELLQLRSLRPEMFADDPDQWKYLPEEDGRRPHRQISDSGFAGEDVLPFPEALSPVTFAREVPYPRMRHRIVPDPYDGPPDFYYPEQPRAERIYPEEDYDYIYGAKLYPRDPLAESLAYFLGSPEYNYEMGDHRPGEEIDFGEVWELDAVRRMGKEAKVPQYLVDSVDPEADEKLLELMVRIAENPEKWQSIHTAMQRVDEALSNSDKASDESYERKEIEKRSSPYMEEEGEDGFRPDHSAGNKLSKAMRKRKRKHFGSHGSDFEDASWERKSRKEEERIRHGTYPEEYYPGDEEEYFLPYESRKPKSAAYASVVFPDTGDRNFDRWRVNYQPVEPEDIEGGVPKDYKHPKLPTRTMSDYDRLAKKKLKMKTMAKAAKEAREKEENAKKEADMRRWKLLKLNKHVRDKWSKVKDLRNGGVDSGEDKSEMSDAPASKEKSPDTWVTPKEHKENWPRFAYHRVTSSPSLQQRDAGALPRHRSAYVAVSVLPTNSTASGVMNAKTEEKFRDPHSEDPPENLPDLMDRPMESGTYQEKTDSLKGMEEKFQMRGSEKVRLLQMMRDGNGRAAPTATATTAT